MKQTFLDIFILKSETFFLYLICGSDNKVFYFLFFLIKVLKMLLLCLQIYIKYGDNILHLSMNVQTTNLLTENLWVLLLLFILVHISMRPLPCVQKLHLFPVIIGAITSPNLSFNKYAED